MLTSAFRIEQTFTNVLYGGETVAVKEKLLEYALIAEIIGCHHLNHSIFNFDLNDLSGGTQLFAASGTNFSIFPSHSGSQAWILGGMNFALGEASVPEPSTLILLALGLAGLGYRRKQKH